MKTSILGSVIISCALGVQAAPVARPQSYDAAGACTVTNFNQVANAVKSCTSITIGDLVVPGGQTLDLTKLKANTHVLFTGRVTFAYKEWSGPLLAISGTGLNVAAKEGSVLDGQGKLYWDGLGSNGGKTKPKFFAAHSLKQSTFTNLYLKNTPIQAFSINSCTGVNFNQITVNNRDGDTFRGHNTDAFDVGSSDGVFIDGAVVYNQDDCLAINSGNNIRFTNGYCSGGHGLSIGSVGGRKNNDVTNVVIENNQIVNSDNGVRIKTVSGATGLVQNITYRNIALTNISKRGIVIQQDYKNGSPTGVPTNGVPIKNLTIDNVHGSVTNSAQPVFILCGSGSCSGWTWKGVNISGGQTTNRCLNVPYGASC